MQSSELWKLRAKTTLNAAKILYRENCFRDVAGRAYYAAYQAATAICIEHGDEVHFPPDWNNPTHDQLPQLVKSNGKLRATDRLSLFRILRRLRKHREDADYRVGISIDREAALGCIHRAIMALSIL